MDTRNDPRRQRLSDEQFEAIANRASEIVESKFYAAVGKTVVRRVLLAVGTGGGFIAAWEFVKTVIAK